MDVVGGLVVVRAVVLVVVLVEELQVLQQMIHYIHCKFSLHLVVLFVLVYYIDDRSIGVLVVSS